MRPLTSLLFLLPPYPLPQSLTTQQLNANIIETDTFIALRRISQQVLNRAIIIALLYILPWFLLAPTFIRHTSTTMMMDTKNLYIVMGIFLILAHPFFHALIILYVAASTKASIHPERQ